MLDEAKIRFLGFKRIKIHLILSHEHFGEKELFAKRATVLTDLPAETLSAAHMHHLVF